MRLLYICTHNACRSILSEAITREISQNDIQVASAGSAANGQVHPLTLKYLQKRGYSTENLESKSWNQIQSFRPDVVVTVCDSAAQETCPAWMGRAIKVHWGLADPSRIAGTDAEIEKAFNAVIDTIEGRIRRLLSQPYRAADSNQLELIFNSIGQEM